MAKFMKKFKDKDEMEKFLKEEGNPSAPMILYVGDSAVRYGSAEKLGDPFIKITVDVSSANVEVPIFNSASTYAVLGVTVDGRSRVIKGNTLKFRKRGKHTIKIYLKDDECYKGLSFKKCDSITEFEFLKDVTEINRGMFEKCTSLKIAIIPKSVDTIVDSAFYGCKNLDSVRIDGELKKIGNEAFYSSGLSGTIKIPPSVEEIGAYAFYKCSGIDSVEILSAEMPKMGKRAFDDGKYIMLTGV